MMHPASGSDVDGCFFCSTPDKKQLLGDFKHLIIKRSLMGLYLNLQ